MSLYDWDELRLTSSEEENVWELFHENSKLTRFSTPRSDDEVTARMRFMWQSLPFYGYPSVQLPTTLSPLNIPLEKILVDRVSGRNMQPGQVKLQDLATTLFYANGITRGNQGTGFPVPFRTVPSAGALYPLEIFFHSTRIDGLDPGFYHFNPIEFNLRLLRRDDAVLEIAEALVQRELVRQASVFLFITALFERSTFKYGDRAYRFILMEAGHIAQNINLVATALNLPSLNIGGFFDHHVDKLLGLDGLTHSTLYVIAIGTKQ